MKVIAASACAAPTIAQQGAHQVLVGRARVQVDARRDRVAAASSACRASPRPAAVAGTPGRRCRRRSARRSRRPPRRPCPAAGSSTSRGSPTWMATTSWRRASSPSGRSQPGSLMKSETTKTSDAAPERCRAPARRSHGEVGRPCRPGPARRGLASSSRAMPQHLVAPVAGRDRLLDRVVEQHARRPGYRRASAACASVAASSVRTRCFCRSTGPKPIDAERSSSSQAVSSRSSMYWRT